MSVTAKRQMNLYNIPSLVDADKMNFENTTRNMMLNHLWIARNFSIKSRKPFQWLLKRLLDLSLSIFGIILISPLLILLAAAIKLESKGPVLFKQIRLGLYGKKFYMYKFRSMKDDADKQFHVVKDMNETNDIMFKASNDPRITKIGRFIRKYSLDELPQLINVLKGEMSLVGPRPPIIREVELYNKWHYLRFTTIPGLTGLWQVSGRARIKDFDNVVKLDYKYMENWNLMLDLSLLAKTIPAVIFAKGAG